jgi:hypothetical protein
MQIDCGLYVDGKRIGSNSNPLELLEQAKANGGFV